MITFYYTTEEGGYFKKLKSTMYENELELQTEINRFPLSSIKDGGHSDEVYRGLLLDFHGLFVHSIYLPRLQQRWDAYNREWYFRERNVSRICNADSLWFA